MVKRKGQGLAEQERTRFYHRVHDFLTRHDLLITPTVSVEPWKAGAPYPPEIDGLPVANYYDWAGLSRVLRRLRILSPALVKTRRSGRASRSDILRGRTSGLSRCKRCNSRPSGTTVSEPAFGRF